MLKKWDALISQSWKNSMKKNTDFMSLNIQFSRIVSATTKQRNSIKDQKCVKMNRKRRLISSLEKLNLKNNIKKLYS